MNPTGSVLTAVIAASAALLGVLLGQLLQSRREERNWNRQSEEQRRRDADQREDQRRRDHELWEREDRHRFANDKRAVYAEFITQTNKAILALQHITELLQLEFQRRERDNEPPLDALRKWLDENQLRDEIADPIVKLGNALSLVRLLASAEVAGIADKVFNNIYSAESRLFDDQEIERTPRTVAAAVATAIKLREAIRKDLGVTDTKGPA